MEGIRDEDAYLSLIKNVLQYGNRRGDRTGTGTISLFAPQNMRFTLSDNTLPLLTTKRVFWRGVAEELLWFISGSTDAKQLSDKGVKIWDGNGSREFLNKLGFTDRDEGDLGPVYGFQWRHFGAEYKGPSHNYASEGVDQLQQVIDTIKNNPYDRRIILSAWNPLAIPQMALPPCHVLAQFYVTDPDNEGDKKRLSCLLYQRSADLGLGIPFNIASYALLTHMIAHVTNTEAYELVIQLGDAHVYSNHVDALKEQLERSPRSLPKLHFKRDIDNIDGFTYDDFSVEGYDPHPKIAMQMAV
ncbi:thymidylate synthase [Wallemia mellicola CBS 633.66]|uniref:thymidylate synthase n=1 Tax=Wallemia mellicola (strain ATCC MYA-4683 / CBS 633.66) TaxID=671144 RepID=I4Y700_WALMC|nr:thymidylate synthase [Wallemia mellicola CBS 633.66]EIM19742.1 thymidylate synthase [Wallemia mellicola CBS 633.66]TIB96621.1 thymidylate synthase [Wallemia mellicola]|eukprot:XP_006960250.1 thymidylate synthase [Wallemia mellicola CBS 633.66]